MKVAGPLIHGRYYTYNVRKCRCEECAEAMRRYHRLYRAVTKRRLNKPTRTGQYRLPFR